MLLVGAIDGGLDMGDLFPVAFVVAAETDDLADLLVAELPRLAH